MVSITFLMVLICISFVHVSILDIWLILSGFVKVLMMPAVRIIINRLGNL